MPVEGPVGSGHSGGAVADVPPPSVVIRLLRRLNELESKILATHAPRLLETLRTKIFSVRAKLPSCVLGHHDRLRARGRLSVAPMHDWVCTSCYLTIHSGNRAEILRGRDLSTCEHCGTFIDVFAGSLASHADTPVGARSMSEVVAPRNRRSQVVE